MRRFDLESPHESWQFLRFVGWFLFVISTLGALLLLTGYQSELSETVRQWEYCSRREDKAHPMSGVITRCGPLQDSIDWFNNRFVQQLFGATPTLVISLLMIFVANRRKQRNIARYDYQQGRNNGE
jgi:hypothetical protein